jgi:ADP-dependent phosphofructokinase/glucokinase
MEPYHHLLQHTELKPTRHMFGGYQLLQKLSIGEAEERLSHMVKLWNELERPTNMIHVEFGHFSNKAHFELFEKYAVRNADSLGMNEVEMKLLLDLWSGSLVDINDQEFNQPTIELVLE